MATAKIVTWSRADKTGKFPIGIKVSQNGTPAYLFEGNTLALCDHWDATRQQIKKAHPHATRLTNFLIRKLAEVNEKILEFETGKLIYSAEDVFNAIRPKPVKDALPETKLTLFKDVAENYLQEQKALGNHDVYKSDRSRLKRFYEFAGDQVTFPQITVELLRRYTIFTHMACNRNKKEQKPLSDRTVINHLLVIRTIYNLAITAGVIGNETYPFGGKDKINIKFGRIEKIGLNIEEINQLKQYSFTAKQSYLHHIYG